MTIRSLTMNPTKQSGAVKGLFVIALLISGAMNQSFATCREPTPGVTKYVDCREPVNGNGSGSTPWNSIAFAATQIGDRTTVVVRGPAVCHEKDIEIRGKTDIRFTTSGGKIQIVSSGDGDGDVDAFRLFSPNTRIFIGAFEITTMEIDEDTTTPLFNEGVVVDDKFGGESDNIILSGVQVLTATLGAGIVIGTPGQNICLNGTNVVGAGSSRSRRNGYAIDVPLPKTLEFLQFINSIAMGNTFDGYSIDQSPATGVVDAFFNGAKATDNDGDGFDVHGGTTTMVNITASRNGRAYENDVFEQGRGVAAGGSVHIENAHVVGNHLVGVNAESTSSALTLIGSTLADNDAPPGLGRMGEQIRANGPTAYIYNTIGDGIVFLAGDALTTCDKNLSTGAGGCASLGGSINYVNDSQPAQNSYKGSLERTSTGVDDGRDLRTTIPNVTLHASGARSRDHDGKPRLMSGELVSGNPGKAAGYDVGAFEAQPTSTPTQTIPGPSLTPSRTPTRTRTHTRTPTIVPCNGSPCTPYCIGDCDCSGTVSISELVGGVSRALRGTGPCACYDRDCNIRVTVDEMVASVNRALHGCPLPGETSCATPTPRATRTPDGGGGTSEGEIPTLRIGVAYGVPGGTVAVPIRLHGGPMAAAQLDIVFDSTVLAIGNPSGACALDTRLTDTHRISSAVPIDSGSPNGKARLRMLVYDDSDPIDSFTDGIVATCSFTIASTTEPGMYAVLGDLAATSGEFGDPFSAASGNGAVVVCGGCGC